jgi:RNA polymerase sigma-70 factor (ECF subfamily)
MENASAYFTEYGSLNWEMVYKTFYDQLYYFARSMIKDKMEAEDIALETLHKLWLIRDRFNNLPNVKAFLFVTTRNACFDYLKHLQCWSKIEKKLQSSLHSNDEPITRQDHRELLNIINIEIENLPAIAKKVFKMRFFEGLTTSEIALQLNIKEQTVRNNKTRAITLLRTALAYKIMAAV